MSKNSPRALQLALQLINREFLNVYFEKIKSFEGTSYYFKMIEALEKRVEVLEEKIADFYCDFFSIEEMEELVKITKNKTYQKYSSKILAEGMFEIGSKWGLETQKILDGLIPPN